MSGFTTPGLPLVTVALTGNELIAADTQLGQGLAPESEAISVSQLKGYYRPISALTFATTIATNALTSEIFQVTLTTNATLGNPTNLQSGQTIRWEIVQDGTGSRTLAYQSLFKFSGSRTVSTTAAAIDLLTATYDGAILLATLNTNYV